MKGAVDLSPLLKPNRSQARAMSRAQAGRARDVRIAREDTLIWLGFDNPGPVKAVKLTPDEARQIARSIELVAGEAEAVLERLVDGEEG